MTEISPLYMWAGGKTRLIKKYAPVWPDSSSYSHYVEPFLGGGAVFCWLYNAGLSHQPILGDVNTELIGLLTAVRDSSPTFIEECTTLVHEYLPLDSKPARKVWYYALRKVYWADPKPSTLYVLMRLGFNGIWQTCKDSHGLFGTPAGLLAQTAPSQIVDPINIQAWSKALHNAVLRSGSYETIPVPTEPSLIYLDPPYRGSFTTYGTVFDDVQQERLIAWARTQAGYGHLVVLANRTEEDITFFEDRLPGSEFHYFDVTYTAGRRKRTDNGHEAKRAREFIALVKP